MLKIHKLLALLLSVMLLVSALPITTFAEAESTVDSEVTMELPTDMETIETEAVREKVQLNHAEPSVVQEVKDPQLVDHPLPDPEGLRRVYLPAGGRIDALDHHHGIRRAEAADPKAILELPPATGHSVHRRHLLGRERVGQPGRVRQSRRHAKAGLDGARVR